jgi:FkbM family methyltransferase
VKSEGAVIVFEPGPNNLPYIRENTKGRRNVHLIEKAVADFRGTASFYIENYSGQNNSLLPDYGMFDENLRSAGLEARVHRTTVDVECITLDEFLTTGGWRAPSLIKIDVEGAELTVLRGMDDALRAGNVVLMVEVTENAGMIWDRLTSAGFRAFTTARSPIDGWERLRGDSFWVKEGDVRYGIFAEGKGRAR